jgi:hypothetical protein
MGPTAPQKTACLRFPSGSRSRLTDSASIRGAPFDSRLYRGGSARGSLVQLRKPHIRFGRCTASVIHRGVPRKHQWLAPPKGNWVMLEEVHMEPIDSGIRVALKQCSAATMTALVVSGAHAGGFDHEVAYDNSGIWNRNVQLALEYSVIATELGGALWLGSDNELGHTFWQTLDASAISAVAAQGMKYAFGRQRPAPERDQINGSAAEIAFPAVKSHFRPASSHHSSSTMPGAIRGCGPSNCCLSMIPSRA